GKMIEDPERTSMSRQREAVIFHHQIMNRDRRQIEFQRMPRSATISGKGDAALGPKIENLGAHRIDSDRVPRDVLRELAIQTRPRLAKVGRLVEVGMHVIEPVRVDDNVSSAGVEARRFDHAYRSPLWYPTHRRGHILPVLAAIAGYVNQAVVAPNPDQILLRRRFGDDEDRVINFDAGVVAGDGTAGPFLFRLVVARQIRTDRFPGLPAIRRLEK